MCVKGLSFSAVGGRQLSRQPKSKMAIPGLLLFGCVAIKAAAALRRRGNWTTSFKVLCDGSPENGQRICAGRFRVGLEQSTECRQTRPCAGAPGQELLGNGAEAARE